MAVTAAGKAVLGRSRNEGNAFMSIYRLLAVFFCLFSILFVIANPVTDSNSLSNQVSATDQDDLIVLGGQDYTVDVSTGDDVVIGGDGDNTYKVFPGSGQITLVEVAGSNTVEFQPGITFSDVASGLWTSGDDLRLVIGGGDQSLTVRDFFAVQDTITSFHFSNGETLSASQLF